ncbi:lipase class 3 [Fusarium pseudocircinatum]|uniref:Lipase class 3 n=1 Tax=Fusarium pseudocircinatum TaxID=56676 RepID=A0A8H5PLC7_9HYPO|nr:lipase class 3 [Fusarium pseudocircinatum]
MTSPNQDLGAFRESFARENLERLSCFDPPSPPDGQPDTVAAQCSISLSLLKKWSKKNMSSIDTAMKAGVFGAKDPIQWTNAFLPFMESVAVYLRDWGLVLEAWRAIRSYKLEGTKDTTRYQDINMHYVHICDLVSESPEGKPYWDGPFCGAFVPNDRETKSPFIGLAFKGTNPFRLKEVAVDYNYQLIKASEALGNQEVSEGVFTGLFGKFESLNTSAFHHTCKKLDELVLLFRDAPTRPRVHVTGHSLGGSYSQLCYAGLLTAITPAFPEHATIGDQYTFGAPRIGSQGWARYNINLVEGADGLTWRIVNNKDIVPQVPPTSLKLDQLNFRHVGNGVRIFTDSIPQGIPDETEGPNPPVYNVGSIKEFIRAVLDGEDHLPNLYYEALVYAIEHAKSK